MAYGPRQIRFHRRLNSLFLASELLLHVIVYYALYYLFDINIASLLIVLIFVFNHTAFSLWLYHAIPEKPWPRYSYPLLILPFFIWLNSSIIILFLSPLLLLYFLFPGIPWLIIILGIALVLSIYATAIRPRKLCTRRLTLPLQTLPTDFTNYRIIHLSDLHIGNLLPMKTYQHWQTAINQEAADLILISGDFLTFGDTYIDTFVDFIAGLQAKDGILLSTGNHEAFIDLDKLQKNLHHRTTAMIIDGKAHEIQRGNTKISIVAIQGIVDNLPVNRRDLDQVLALTSSTPIVLLSHEGSIFDDAAAKKIPLTLSGHTHGGQLALPFISQINLATKKYRYNSGHYQNKHSHLYVSNGMGLINLPMRLGAPPELAVLTLTTAK